MQLLSLWWLQPDHPILHEPNEGITLRNFTNFWKMDGDKGDQIRLSGQGDAVLLAGLHAEEPSRYGALITCMQGRLIIQTFSSHECRPDDIIALWQNYIYNALKNHFNRHP